jgi:hypothetical protein
MTVTRWVSEVRIPAIITATPLEEISLPVANAFAVPSNEHWALRSKSYQPFINKQTIRQLLDVCVKHRCETRHESSTPLMLVADEVVIFPIAYLAVGLSTRAVDSATVSDKTRRQLFCGVVT